MTAPILGQNQILDNLKSRNKMADKYSYKPGKKKKRKSSKPLRMFRHHPPCTETSEQNQPLRSRKDQRSQLVFRRGRLRQDRLTSASLTWAVSSGGSQFLD